ncbi:receptor expression-enhancing protein 1 isoform X1 [Ixodes scapularis]|uniref:receptor expression-enhancing protein 1 isoform X1 n=1 Tax=Ixodes scapularis TaxID=6945 RepID=UPI0011615B39|nr:receptor expression-enhancing protein 1 isoform X1 [Ixodes scapularis]
MISGIISRLIVMVCGMLYPAYASYKAVKNKDVREYMKWMMYWVVFALFTCVETFADILISWLPFYYEIKILFVLWLLSPATMGSSILYRRFVHPQLMLREPEIDEMIARARDQGYTAVLQLGSRGLSYAANVVVQTAIKGHQVVTNHVLRELAVQQMAGQITQAEGYGGGSMERMSLSLSGDQADSLLSPLRMSPGAGRPLGIANAEPRLEVAENWTNMQTEEGESGSSPTVGGTVDHQRGGAHVQTVKNEATSPLVSGGSGAPVSRRPRRNATHTTRTGSLRRSARITAKTSASKQLET